MFRVGILGAENSHAMAFTEIFNGLKPEYAREFADIKVVAVGGDYPEENKKVFERGGLELLAHTPEDMLGMVDAVMVTARDGKYHAAFARPFIEAGIPAFIDKPFTSNPEEALSLIHLARERNVPLVGGSSVKLCPGIAKMRSIAAKGGVISGDVTAPVSMKNDYGNFWFYSAHLVESCLAVFGYNPEWVWANRHAGGVIAVMGYRNFSVTCHFNEGVYTYSATIATKEGVQTELLDISDIYASECRSFANMLRTGAMDHSYAQLAAPVLVLSAIEKSFQTDEKQRIQSV